MPIVTNVRNVNKNDRFLDEQILNYVINVDKKACKIILGPPKHVLHLVSSVLCISTAIKTAMKVAPTGSSKWSINGKVNHYN